MVQPTGRPRFLFEAAPAHRVIRELLRQDFDRDVPLQLRVACAVHLSHPARAERAEDFETAEAVADPNSHLEPGEIIAGRSRMPA